MTIRLAFEKPMPWFLGPAGCAGNLRIPIVLNLYFLELTSFALLRLFKEDWCIFGDIVATRLFRENQMYSNVTLPYLRLVQLSVWGETLHSKSGTNFVVACVTKNSMNCLRSAFLAFWFHLRWNGFWININAGRLISDAGTNSFSWLGLLSNYWCHHDIVLRKWVSLNFESLFGHALLDPRDFLDLGIFR